jgi:ADP-ribose pyrophosphatase
MQEHGWKTLRAKLIGTISLREVELPTGKRIDYLVVSYPEAVGILALTPDKEVIMVGQYRYAVEEYSWEIPAGNRDAGESVEDCARRELEEETGYRAGQIDLLFSFHPTNGATNQVVHLCLASDLTLVAPVLTHKEPIEETIRVEPVAFNEALNKVLRGELHDAATVIALLLYAERERALTA